MFSGCLQSFTYLSNQPIFTFIVSAHDEVVTLNSEDEVESTINQESFSDDCLEQRVPDKQGRPLLWNLLRQTLWKLKLNSFTSTSEP